MVTFRFRSVGMDPGFGDTCKVGGARRSMKTWRIATVGLLVCATAWPAPPLPAQQDNGIVAAALRMRQLDGVKRVLMIAAHPDDEDTGLLTVLARGMGAETAYLSLSRGEGGQNLIGPRLHEGLGVIRTGELLSARALDGGGQFFTRAFDFGYSKSIDEALELWPLEEVLRDAVYVVRKFRPQVIVAVFSGTPRDGHGQHQVAGVVAREVFAAAGDPDRFPELARWGVEPWTPAKLYRSVRFSPRDATLTVPTGTFDPVLGRSHFQLAMDSRSQHRSQDMGSGQSMGPRSSSLRLEESRVGTKGGAVEGDGVFAGVDTTLFGQLPAPLPAGWPGDTRERLERYRLALAEAAEGLSVVRPDEGVAGLSEAAAILRELAEQAPEGDGRRLLERRLGQVAEAVLAAAGVVTDVRVARDLLTPGESVVVDVNVWNGGPFALAGVDPVLVLPEGWVALPTEESAVGPSRSPFFRAAAAETPAGGRIAAGEIGRWSWRVEVPSGARHSVPYYLEEERPGGLYAWPEDGRRWALPFDPAPVAARVAMELLVPGGDRGVRGGDGAVRGGGAAGRGGDSHTLLAVEREGVYVGVDKASGEYREPVLVVPAVTAGVEPRQMAWPTASRASRDVTVVLTNTSANPRSGSVRLDAPEGWTVEPAEAGFSLEPGGASASFTFALTPTGEVAEGSHVFRVFAQQPGEEPSPTGFASRDRFFDRFPAESVKELDIVDYPHIPRAVMLRDAQVEITALPVVADTDLRVGYIMGSGDDGAAALRQIGMQVEELGEARVRGGDYSGYDVLVLGVRAYETRPDLAAANEALLDFARAGGTVIVQYNKYEFPAGGFAPFPVSMSRPHDRVTDETAAVTLLAPASPVFSAPNAIGPADFEGWVQERGLYFLGEWDERYTPVMEMADPGEEPKRGGLVVAPAGDGLYVYTGLAFFRQFPAGVPGAYRLFANLVSMRALDWKRAIPIG